MQTVIIAILLVIVLVLGGTVARLENYRCWEQATTVSSILRPFCYNGLVMSRRFPSPSTVEPIEGGFKVVDANPQPLAYVL